MANIRAAIRSLLKSPGFSLVAILTLGVGIAANAALFSVYDRLVLRPVTLPDTRTLVAIWSNNPQANFNVPALSWPRYQAIAGNARTFSSVAVSAFDNFTLTGNGEQPDQLNGLRVSGAFFPTIGVRPALGRDFTPEEDVPNGPAVCIISHELWTTRFGSRASIVNENIQLNGQSWQVVGIMPPQLSAPFAQVQVFAPRVFEVAGLTAQQIDAGAGYAQVIARLGKGVTRDQAQTEMNAIAAGYKSQFAAKLDSANASVVRDFVDAFTGNLKPTFYTLLGAVAFVLLIACANVASLFVGRLAHRQREIAVRQSLGATRAGIVRQFMTESLVYAIAAGLVGAFLARLSLAGLEKALSAALPPNTHFSLDWRAWTFIELTALVSAALVGFFPALQASKPALVDTLKDASRGSSSSHGGRVRSALIVVEVALSVVLLVGSSLLLLSFVSLQRTPPGFNPAGVASAFVGLPATTYPTNKQQADFYVRVVEELKRNPRVSFAAASLSLPLTGGARAPYSVLGRTILPLPQRPLAALNSVSDDYFKMLDIPVIEGRAFGPDDRDGSPGVCIINKQLADRLFPGESALGHVLLRGRDADVRNTIVGVVGDVKSNGLNVAAPDAVYYALRQFGRSGMAVAAKTTGTAADLQSVLRSAVAAVDKDQPISFFQTMDVALSQSLGVQRIVAALTGVFALIALVLAAVGLYAVVSYAVTQRTGEIGIRMALGARPGQVLSLIMKSGLTLVAIGVAIGLASAAGTAQLIAAQLSNVRPLDPIVYVSVALFFAAVAAAACLVPAARASRINPVVALSGGKAARRA
jgi:putative ABC transport system permease protein